MSFKQLSEESLHQISFNQPSKDFLKQISFNQLSEEFLQQISFNQFSAESIKYLLINSRKSLYYKKLKSNSQKGLYNKYPTKTNLLYVLKTWWKPATINNVSSRIQPPAPEHLQQTESFSILRSLLLSLISSFK